MCKRIFRMATSELVLWSAALIALFFMGGGPDAATLCVFHAFGFIHCPGCGLGNAIHEALHLHWTASFNHHPLGIPVLLLLLGRVASLLLSRSQNHTPWITSN